MTEMYQNCTYIWQVKIKKNEYAYFYWEVVINFDIHLER